eukprot:Skav205719  [mRNA]  locus=scaffold1496:62331:63035:- [translate_table: standard]
MCAVENGRSPRLRLSSEEVQNPFTSKQIQVRGDLVHQINRPRSRQTLKKLAPASHSIGDFVDLPLHVHL